MIFVTVGSAQPFERLIIAMDAWAAAHPAHDVFMQIGRGHYLPRHGQYARILRPLEFAEKLSQASVIVAHAGFGSAFDAGQAARPIVLLPRRLELKEHNTGHQLDGIGWLRSRLGAFIAADETELDLRIAEAMLSRPGGHRLPAAAPPEFTDRLRETIF